MTVRILLVTALALVASLALACGSKPQPAAVTMVSATAVASTPPPAAPTATVTPKATAVPAPVVKACNERATHWIDVNVSSYRVRLMEGSKVVQELGPVAVGREVDSGNYESTQTGCFSVYNKNADLTYDAPYKTYIAFWVGFDPQKDNGFHSFLLDAKGNVVDGSTGRISNGCIRTGQAETIFKFAEVGMPVWVHA